jgi:hypothetical protein
MPSPALAKLDARMRALAMRELNLGHTTGRVGSLLRKYVPKYEVKHCELNLSCLPRRKPPKEPNCPQPSLPGTHHLAKSPHPYPAKRECCYDDSLTGYNAYRACIPGANEQLCRPGICGCMANTRHNVFFANSQSKILDF